MTKRCVEYLGEIDAESGQGRAAARCARDAIVSGRLARAIRARDDRGRSRAARRSSRSGARVPCPRSIDEGVTGFIVDDLDDVASPRLRVSSASYRAMRSASASRTGSPLRAWRGHMSTSTGTSSTPATSEPSQDYHILATSSRADERTRVVKHDESFGVFDPAGMIHA